jgi:hypothetical protein
MFVRFRETATSLQATLIETHRVDGKVRHEHVASLGSIPWPAKTADRITFWQKLHERFAKLSNRLTDDQRAAVMGAIHARIPITAAEDQHAVQLDNAQAEASFWDSLAEMHGETIEGYKALIQTATKKIDAAEAEQRKAANHAAKAKDRIERIERGENVPGIGKRMTPKDMEKILRNAGWTTADIKHVVTVAAIGAYGEDAYRLFDEATKRLFEERLKLEDKERHRAAREILAALEAGSDA